MNFKFNENLKLLQFELSVIVLNNFNFLQIILLCLVAFAAAADPEIIPIVSQNFEMSDDLLTYKQK